MPVTDEHGGRIMRRPEADYLDDGPQKPIRIWSRIGPRPLLAAGDSNGDIPMLDFNRHPAGAEQALERANATT